MNPLHSHSVPPRRADQRAVRISNLSLVARRIAESGSLSRAQLAKLTGLNKTTVSSLVAELIERGLVSESGLADGRRVGRPAQILELDDSRIAALGLEINVDYLAVCVCDLRGALRFRRVLGHDNRQSSPERVFEALAELVGAALAECDSLGLTPIGAGVSLPGTVEARDRHADPRAQPRLGSALGRRAVARGARRPGVRRSTLATTPTSLRSASSRAVRCAASATPCSCTATSASAAP